LDAFLDIVGGSVGLLGPDMTVDSRIVETVLANTHELKFLTDYEFQLSKNSKPTLQMAFRDSDHADIAGFLSPTATDPSYKLARGLEMLSQNLTVSLMGSPYFS
jgi:hypothetical protein